MRLALALLFAAGPALAHGDAAWIMADKRYVDAEGLHCCGPADCYPVAADAIEINPGRCSTAASRCRRRSAVSIGRSTSAAGFACVPASCAARSRRAVDRKQE